MKNIETNKLIKNSINDDKQGVIEIIKIWLKLISSIIAAPTVLTNPTINVINNILTIPTNTFVKSILVLDIGKTAKYSIVLSLSSFNTILEPNIAE